MANKVDLSLDAIIAKEGIVVDKKGPKSGQTANGLSGKRKAEGMTFVVNNTSAESSHFGLTSGQIFVDNLKYKVTDEDIHQLFGAFGTLKRAAVNYQRDGRSAGSGFVVFNNKSDAQTALESLQGVTLDGRPLELVAIDSGTSSMVRKDSDMTARLKRQAKEFSGGTRQMWSDIAKKYEDSPTEQLKGYRRFNRSHDKEEKESVSAEDLDADLDSYLAQRNKS